MLKRKTVQAGLLALLLMATTMGLSAEARTVHKILADKSGTTFLNLPVGNENVLKVLNPTDAPVLFTVPAVGLSATIPAHESESFIVNSVDMIQRYVFYTISGSGTTTSSSSSSSSSSSQWPYGGKGSTLSLEKIINYNTDYEITNDPEPLYHEPQPYGEMPAPPPVEPAAKRRMVRGYW